MIKITRKGRRISVDGVHLITLHETNGCWHFSQANLPYTLGEGFHSFRLAVKGAKEFLKKTYKEAEDERR